MMKISVPSLLVGLFRLFNRKISAFVAITLLFLPLGLWHFANWLITPESRWGKLTMLVVGGCILLVTIIIWSLTIGFSWEMAFPKFNNDASRKRPG